MSCAVPYPPQERPAVFVITTNEDYQIFKNRLKLFNGNDAPIRMDFTTRR